MVIVGLIPVVAWAWFSLAAFSPASAAVPIADQTQTAKVQKELVHRYDELIHAMERQDFHAAKQILTVDFQASLPTGESLDCDQIIKHYDAVAQEFSHLKWTRNIKILDSNADTATAVTECHFAALTRKGKKRRLDLYSTTRDLWTLVQGTWQLRSCSLVKSRYLVDGRAPDIAN